MKKYVIVIASFLILCTSCSVSRKVTYSLKDYKPSTENVNKSISIQLFDDIRFTNEENQFYQTATSNQKKIDGNFNCITAEKYYKIPVNQQMTDMFVNYLKKKEYFSNVFVNQKDIADYYVTAKIKNFTGYQAYSAGAAIGAQFGLIGALVTAGIKTEGKIVIEIVDIQIFDKNGNEVAFIDDISQIFEGKMLADAYCWCIYGNLNQKLSLIYEDFGDKIFKAILTKNILIEK